MKVCTLFLLLSVTTSGADFEAQVLEARKALTEPLIAKRLEAGKHIYSQRCARCHGVPGKTHGRSFFADAPDLSTEPYKYRSTKTGQNPRDADILRVITEGVPGTRMPGFSFLSLADRWAVVLYLKSLNSYFTGAPEPDALPIPPAPAHTPERVASGEGWYFLQRCYDCHGLTGKGDGPLAPGLKDGQNRPIKPANFRLKSAKSGSTASDLYRTVLTGLDGTPMAAFGEGTFLMAQDSQKVKEDDKFVYPALDPARLSVDEATRIRLQKFIDGLPTQAQLAKMSPSQKEKYEGERRWELIYYIQSLRGKKE